MAGANKSFESTNFRIFALWDGENIYFWNFLKHLPQGSYCFYSWCWKMIKKLTEHMLNEGSRFHVKHFLYPEGKGINDGFAKREIQRQISEYFSVRDSENAKIL